MQKKKTHMMLSLLRDINRTARLRSQKSRANRDRELTATDQILLEKAAAKRARIQARNLNIIERNKGVNA